MGETPGFVRHSMVCKRLCERFPANTGPRKNTVHHATCRCHCNQEGWKEDIEST